MLGGRKPKWILYRCIITSGISRTFCLLGHLVGTSFLYSYKPLCNNLMSSQKMQISKLSGVLDVLVLFHCLMALNKCLTRTVPDHYAHCLVIMQCTCNWLGHHSVIIYVLNTWRACFLAIVQLLTAALWPG